MYLYVSISLRSNSVHSPCSFNYQPKGGIGKVRLVWYTSTQLVIDIVLAIVVKKVVAVLTIEGKEV